MSPEQKLKWAILAKVAGWENQPILAYPCENVDEIYSALVARNEHWDGLSEVRCGTTETGLPCAYSRYFEAKAVAQQMPDGSWVGWTYWYGGGKHAEPEAIEWMEEAYDLDCSEEERMVVVQTFKPKE